MLSRAWGMIQMFTGKNSGTVQRNQFKLSSDSFQEVNNAIRPFRGHFEGISEGFP